MLLTDDGDGDGWRCSFVVLVFIITVVMLITSLLVLFTIICIDCKFKKIFKANEPVSGKAPAKVPAPAKGMAIGKALGTTTDAGIAPVHTLASNPAAQYPQRRMYLVRPLRRPETKEETKCLLQDEPQNPIDPPKSETMNEYLFIKKVDPKV